MVAFSKETKNPSQFSRWIFYDSVKNITGLKLDCLYSVALLYNAVYAETTTSYKKISDTIENNLLKSFIEYSVIPKRQNS